MNKSEIVSFYDPSKPIQTNPNPQAVVDVELVGRALMGVLADGSRAKLVDYQVKPGRALETATIDSDGSMVVQYNDGTNRILAGVKNNTQGNSAYLGTGLYSETLLGPIPGKVASPYAGMFYIWNNPTDRKRDLQTEVILQDDTRITCSSSYSGGQYALGNAFRRPTALGSPGFIFGSQPISTQFLQIEFPIVTKVNGYVHAHFLNGWATLEWEVYHSSDGQAWNFIARHQKPMVIERTLFLFPETISCKYLRFIPKVNQLDGSFGIIDPVVRSNNLLLKHIPLVFDPETLNVVETPSTFRISPKQAPIPVNLVSNLTLDSYARLEWVVGNVSQQLIGTTGNWFSMARLRLNRKSVDSIGIVLNRGTFKLPSGRYTITVNGSLAGGDYGLLAIINAKSQAFAATPHSIIPGIVGNLVTAPITVNFDLECTADIDTFYLAVICNQNSGTISNAVAFTVDIWRQPVKVPTLQLNLNQLKPPTVSEMNLLEIIFTPLLNAVNHPHLVDGLWPTGGGVNLPVNGVIVAYFSDYFRLWRTGHGNHTSVSTNNAILRIVRLEDGVDFSNRHLSISPINNQQWQLWTEDLPPGTYEFISLGSRTDGEWIAERRPAFTYTPSKRIQQALPMTSMTHPTQVLTRSSENAVNVWNVFNYTQWPPTTTWSTVVTDLPHWVAVSFLDGVRVVNGYSWIPRPPPARSPKKVALQGRNSATDSWVTLHEMDNLSIPGTNQTYGVSGIGPFSYSQYRLLIDEVTVLGTSDASFGITRWWLYQDIPN